MSGSVEWLQEYYSSLCDGEWEHSYGIQIGTLDNPGWAVRIDLIGTSLQDIGFEVVEIERSEIDWLRCSVVNGVFEVYCGPKNLVEALSNFQVWANKSQQPTVSR